MTMRLFSLLTALAVLISANAGFAQTFPAPNNTRVVDAANILDPAQEAALDTKLKGLEDSTDRQLVVATIPDLEGYAIDDYGYRLGRTWGIGQKGTNNGAVLIVAPKDRKTRIEVGYGLEPILTDALTSVIINSQMIPHFRDGDYPGGINAGVDTIITQLKLPPEEAAKRAKAVVARSDKGGGNLGSILFWLFIFFFFILPVISPVLFGRGKRGRRFGSGPVIIWGGGNDWGGGSGGGSSWGSGGGFGGGGGFSGGGGSFGGGGSSGGW
jgi:uncharacterized protein